MKQSRCWKAGTAAVLIVAGLSILPREGAAWSGYIDPIEPVLFGEPDEPISGNAPAVTVQRTGPVSGVYVPVLSFTGGSQVISVCLPAWFTLKMMQWLGPSTTLSRMGAGDSSR